MAKNKTSADTAYLPLRPKHNNAAGRLHEILKRVGNCADGANTTEAWWDALNVETQLKIAKGQTPAQRKVLFRLLSVLSASLDEIERQAKERFAGNEELYVSHLIELRPALAPHNLDTQISVYKQFITPAGMLSLGHCAMALPKEDALPEEEITALYNLLDHVKLMIRGTDLDTRLREWLLELVNEMHKALDEYELCGGKSFEKSWSYLFGNLVMRHPDYAEVKVRAPTICEEIEEVLHKIGDFAVRTYPKAGIVTGLIALAGVSAVQQIGSRIGDGVVDTFVNALTYSDDPKPEILPPIDDEPQSADGE